MTYIPTWTGFLYLAVVMDAYSRKVVGWAMGERMTADWVAQAGADGKAVIDAYNGTVGEVKDSSTNNLPGVVVGSALVAQIERNGAADAFGGINIGNIRKQGLDVAHTADDLAHINFGHLDLGMFLGKGLDAFAPGG